MPARGLFYISILQLLGMQKPLALDCFFSSVCAADWVFHTEFSYKSSWDNSWLSVLAEGRECSI